MISPAELVTNYTYAQALAGTVAVAGCAGAVGPLVYLRRQSLMVDAVSHASFPGLIAVFIVAASLGFNGRNVIALTCGAVALGCLAVAAINYLPKHSPLKTDAVMAAVLSTFFSLGMLLMQYVARHPLPGKAGIQDYLLGNASTLTRADVISAALVGALTVLALGAVHFPLALAVFDPAYRRFEPLVFLVLTVVAVIGIKVVGVVLMVAVVVAPAAAARQWVKRLPEFIALSAALGALSAAVGTYASVNWAIPAGPAIVLVQAAIVAASLINRKVRS